jgi:hypothetical protein
VRDLGHGGQRTDLSGSDPQERWAARPIAVRRDRADPVGVRNPELLPAFCLAIAVELAHLRWIILTQWKCRTCATSHLHCECKPAWMKYLL